MKSTVSTVIIPLDSGDWTVDEIMRELTVARTDRLPPFVDEQGEARRKAKRAARLAGWLLMGIFVGIIFLKAFFPYLL